MLSIMPPAVVPVDFSAPQIIRLAGLVFAIVWDVARPPPATAPSVTANGARLAPSSSLRLALSTGGTRVVIAFRAASREPVLLHLQATMLAPLVEIRLDPGFVAELSHRPAILSGLTSAGRRLLVSAMAATWPSLFKMGRNAAYARNARLLIETAAGQIGAMRALGATPDGGFLLAGAIPAGANAIDDVHVLSQSGISRLPAGSWIVSPGKTRGGSPVHLMIESTGEGGLLVLKADNGLVVRSIPQRPRNASLAGWWTAKGARNAGLRDWVVHALTNRSASGQALARELQTRLPLPATALRQNGATSPSIGIEVAVATPAGLFVAGWRRDPANLIEEVSRIGPDGARTPLGPRIHLFPGHLASAPDADALPATGFVGLLPDAIGMCGLQPRFIARLISGTEVNLIPGLQPGEPVGQRALIAASVPPRHLTNEMLETSFGPAFAALQSQIRGLPGEPTCLILGQPTPKPHVSIVIPLYRVLEFLRTQLACFAADPWIRDKAEIVFVLDSPEQAAECEHLLRGLHLVYGLSMRLVVMARNGGFSAACNAGAAASSGRVLAFVNSDVIPAANGWLAGLAEAVGLKTRVGAVGPKLLFADGSLQHAGLFFKRDHRGQWLNHHFFKGRPGRYAPADLARSVPGVTGACMLVPRGVFDEVGGFTQDYIIGDYEDSDLCLKIRSAGYDILYRPDAVLFHLERQSIRHSLDYTSGIVSQHNSWLQTRRWDADITELMAQFEGLRPKGVSGAVAKPAVPAKPAAQKSTRPGSGRRRDGAISRLVDPLPPVSGVDVAILSLRDPALRSIATRLAEREIIQ